MSLQSMIHQINRIAIAIDTAQILERLNMNLSSVSLEQLSRIDSEFAKMIRHARELEK